MSVRFLVKAISAISKPHIAWFLCIVCPYLIEEALKRILFPREG